MCQFNQNTITIVNLDMFQILLCIYPQNYVLCFLSSRSAILINIARFDRAIIEKVKKPILFFFRYTIPCAAFYTRFVSFLFYRKRAKIGNRKNRKSIRLIPFE